eukprot:11117586-Alexandrium_andersonii.AAC.1
MGRNDCTVVTTRPPDPPAKVRCLARLHPGEAVVPARQTGERPSLRLRIDECRRLRSFIGQHP